MGFVDENGEYVGFDIDLAKEVTDRLGVELVLQPISWDSKELELSGKNIDCIWSGLTMTPERIEQMTFSIPYLANEQILVVRSDSGIASEADLSGKVLGTQAGSSSVDVLNANPDLMAAIGEPQLYDDFVTALMDLKLGGIDVLLIDSVVGNYYIAQQDDPTQFTVLPEVLEAEEYGIAFRKGEQTLADAVSQQLIDMFKDGTLDTIRAKWFANDITLVAQWKQNISLPDNIIIPADAIPALNKDDHVAYIIGYEDGTVRPNGRITRAEVATIFFRLLTDDARQRNWSSENNFSDVSADKWYNNAVSTLCHMGVLGGYSDGTFRPNAPITRAEFAKIAVSFSQANGSAVYSYFTDVKTTDWFAPYVTAAKDSSLIEGYSDGSFKPENRITRAEACAIVNRVLGRKPSKSHMKISGRIDWPDCTTADWFYEAIMEATNSHTYQMGKRVETWNDKLPQRDWAALETGWANAYTGR